MRGVALESLVQGWNSEIPTEPYSLLSRENHTDEWEAQILLALLRLGFQPITKRAIAHISKRIAAGDRTVLPLLAALCKPDAEACLNMAVPFLVGLVNSCEVGKLSGYVPAIVNHFLDADPTLLALLVRRIAVRSNEVARETAQLISEYLDRRDVTDRIGEEQVNMLKQSVNAALARVTEPRKIT